MRGMARMATREGSQAVMSRKESLSGAHSARYSCVNRAPLSPMKPCSHRGGAESGRGAGWMQAHRQCQQQRGAKRTMVSSPS